MPIYVFKNFTYYFIISLFIFISIFLMLSFIQMTNDEAVIGGFSQYLFIKSLLYLIPSIISTSAPFSFIMSLMLCFSELENSGEMTAIRAGGYSYKDVSIHLGIFTIFLSIALLILNNFYGPIGMKESRENLKKMFTRITNIHIKSNTFEKISDFSMYTQKVEKDNKMFHIKLFKTEKNLDGISIFSILSKNGNYNKIDTGLNVEMSSGSISYIKSSNPDVYFSGNFQKYETYIPFYFDSRERTYNLKELTTFELLNDLNYKNQETKHKTKSIQQILLRIFFALSPLSFFFLAISISGMLKKEGKVFAFILSLAIAFFYYGFLTFFEFLSFKNSKLFPWLMYMPFAFFFILGLYLWHFKLRER